MSAILLLGTLLLAVLSNTFAQSNELDNPLPSYSLQAPYLEDTLSNPLWDFGGDAMMEVNRYVRLTTDARSQSGWLWSKTPMTHSSWMIEFQFKVAYDGGISGDGFAFWYTTERAQEGPVFGGKDKFNGLGLFFDTYANSKHVFPYVMAMIGDGKKEYDHDFDGNNADIGGCHAEFRNREHITKARVKYTESGHLQLDLNIIGDDQWTTCLKVDNVKLPKQGFFGFSALTGAVSSSHDIIEISTYGVSNGSGGNNATTGSMPASHKDDYNSNKPTNQGSTKPEWTREQQKKATQESRGWSATMIILIIFVGVVVGYAGWVIYKTSKANSYKRF
ncbi:hypothetical protein O5D80_007186 [Batrachochytrium dendrobatidis]|nr:hypothetical protein O5D80_007186 [Batrachochytrium dendrobatidis]